ncbi:hypothetical protein GCM10011331_03290 [Flavimobilis marinus]|uniref:Uncharacterized protein n=1 Tax=Flavimobilis marinus TaxID=285351 RepID=A0A1I2DQH5_9MICO|nr:hypothetical protein [Flavimobilis marinus]GHG44597.1 hypothetical protein GCM10011331_03290 [Flavimobilis marinus]SFE82748.1 hypothetical protein SAMN04488035_0672 [Flavimobilis marinus]
MRSDLRLTSVLPHLLPWWTRVAEHPPRVAAFRRPHESPALEAALARLPAQARARVLHPLVPAPGTRELRWGSAVARQHDGTTCGSAVLAMTAAAGDLRLALWLETGERCGGRTGPVELTGVAATTLDGLGDAEARFAFLQRRLKTMSNGRAAAGLPWPAALGTPPWGAARVARWGAVRYRHAIVGGPRQSDVLAAVASWGQAGVPVPLFAGGDLARGVATAVPRHVVLVTGVVGPVWSVYEPSSGAVHEVTRGELVAGGRLAALGGWNHLAWALVPRAGAAVAA